MEPQNTQVNKLPAGSIVGASSRGVLGEAIQQKLDPRSKFEKTLAVASSPFRWWTGDTGSTIGEAIGTEIARMRATPEEKQFITPGPTAGAIAGDVTGAAIDIAGGPLLSGGLKIGGRLISKTGATLFKQAIPLSKTEAGILQSYKANNPFLQRVKQVFSGTENQPRTAGQTALEKGFAGFTRGGIGVQAKREANKIWQSKISPALESSKERVNIPGFLGEVEKDIIEKVPDLTRRNSLIEALNSVKDDYKNIQDIPIKQLQKYKEGWAEFVPEKTYQGKSIGGALAEVRNLLARKSREKIYNSLGKEIRNDYLDYGNLKGLQELGKSSMTGEKLKGGAGSLVTDLMQRATTPITTGGGQALYKTGKGLTKLGELGNKNVKLSPFRK